VPEGDPTIAVDFNFEVRHLSVFLKFEFASYTAFTAFLEHTVPQFDFPNGCTGDALVSPVVRQTEIILRKHAQNEPLC
jgi:hypothetical protein